MTSTEDRAREVGSKIVVLLREYLAEGGEVSPGEISLWNGAYCIELWQDDEASIHLDFVKYEPGKRVVIE